ncbi:mycothione reductase [Gordonia effusa NBRC 100432]|uniref:Mycothione reductase n=1 Tax=Gordonia effusa NBRC 100432 TaxID=1077974 RepID=H0R252_9ACTN|nr:mycothione reductase [Gordonia effusa]GAB19157.1 mycothione reductase [Gordonia effusa NBRC 100432]
MTTTEVDVALIGSGSGNTFANRDFHDTSFALFEEGVFGGTCLNVGCIPTKMFVYAADIADHIRESSRYGVEATLNSTDWPGIVKRVFDRIDPISSGGRDYRADRSPNLKLYESHVEFDGRDGERYRLRTADNDLVLADQVVIAAGSRPIIPDVIAGAGVRYYTNSDVMRLAELPRRMTILGSGYIAAEFAHVFSALGTEVTIVARGPKLLRHHDSDISGRFTELATQQWSVLLDRTTVGASTLGDGSVRLSFGDGSHVDSDVLLIATGRLPNGDRLNLGSIGVGLDDDGRIERDIFGRTSAHGVWALGDVATEHQLRHVANHETRVVQANVKKGWDAADLVAFDHRFVPSAVFSHPQIATVGLTEEQAARAGIDYAVKVQAYADVAYGWAMEDTTSFCKVLADRATGQLIGVHILGPQASTVIQPAIQAMSFGLGVHDMARGQYWIHPALPEVLENALLGLEQD